MRGKAKYEDYSITLFYMLYISLYRLILKRVIVQMHIKMTRYVRELYSQSQRLVRQSSCHLSGKHFTEMQYWSVKCKLCIA